MFTIKSIEGKAIKFDITDEITKVEYSPYGYIYYVWKEGDINKKIIEGLEYSTCYVIKYTFKKDNIECTEITDYITTLSELDDMKRQIKENITELNYIKKELNDIKKQIKIKENDYTKFLRSCVYELKKLQKLSIDEINEYENDLYRMYFYAFYGYVIKLDEFALSDIITPISSYTKDIYNVASFGGQIEVLKYLTKRGFCVNESNNDGDNAYLCAAYGGEIEVMKYLEEIGFNIHTTNKAGINAYLRASYGGHIEVMKYLEEKGFDIHIKNKYGNNAYLIASANNQLEVMKYLEERGFDIHIKNNYGEDASTIASYGGFATIAKYLESKRIQKLK